MSLLRQLVLLLACVARAYTVTLHPYDKRISYTGRFDTHDPAGPEYSWVMTTIRTEFSGSEIWGFWAASSRARLRVSVNDSSVDYVLIDENRTRYSLARGLNSNGTHRIAITKVSEDMERDAEMGTIQFRGLEGQGSFPPSAPPALHRRRLDFIGDSDTAGFCVDGSPDDPVWDPNRDEISRANAHDTWAQHLARGLSAETLVEAVSGYGVTNVSHPIQGYIDYVNGHREKSLWDYSRYTPAAVLILIGPNDMFLNSNANRTQAGNSWFVRRYLQLLNQVAFNYRNAQPPVKIVNVCGGSINGLEPCDYIERAQTLFNQNRSSTGIRSYSTALSNSTWHRINGNASFQGCDGHYNQDGHRVFADEILPGVRAILSWAD